LAEIDISAGMSPGLYDVVAFTPGGGVYGLHAVVEVLVDTDADGLGDEDEVLLGTDIADPDTDGDGVLDGDEIVMGADPLDTDSDDDGITDGDEVAQGTNPADADTDGDGVNDAEDVEPLVADIIPPDVLCTVTPVSGQVKMNFGASDAQAATVTSAVLTGGSPPGSCVGPPVKQDQIFNAKCNDACSTGFFSLEGPGLAFVVTATDPSGNVGTCTVPLCDQVTMDLSTNATTTEDTVVWSGYMGTSAYRVIRGNLGLPQGNPPPEAAECISRTSPDIQPQQITMSQANLSPGSILFYLVATENPQGAVSFGLNGAGETRATLPTTCPPPS
jgi:hypothetical protein